MCSRMIAEPRFTKQQGHTRCAQASTDLFRRDPRGLSWVCHLNLCCSVPSQLNLKRFPKVQCHRLLFFAADTSDCVLSAISAHLVDFIGGFGTFRGVCRPRECRALRFFRLLRVSPLSLPPTSPFLPSRLLRGIHPSFSLNLCRLTAPFKGRGQ